MVPKRSNLLEDPPSASSSEEEEEASGQEYEEGEEEEKEEGKDRTAKESESETDSDTDLYVKSTASKPMDYKIGNGQSYTASTPKSAAAATAKRGAETSGDLKRAKLEDGTKLFQRLWSDEDEISVLNGLIEFAERRRIDPTKDLVAFIDFIEKDLSIKVHSGQVEGKVRRLKRKFKNNMKKAKGEEKTFRKGHDQKVFDLSKKIWGREGIIGRGTETESVVKSNGMGRVIGKRLAAEKKGKNVGVEMEKVGGSGKFHWTGGMEEHVLRRGMELLDGSRKDEMEEKLWKLHVEELALFIKKNELMRVHAKLVLAACNKMDED